MSPHPDVQLVDDRQRSRRRRKITDERISQTASMTTLNTTAALICVPIRLPLARMTVSATRFRGAGPVPRPAASASQQDSPPNTPCARPGSCEIPVGALGCSNNADGSRLPTREPEPLSRRQGRCSQRGEE